MSTVRREKLCTNSYSNDHLLESWLTLRKVQMIWTHRLFFQQTSSRNFCKNEISKQFFHLKSVMSGPVLTIVRVRLKICFHYRWPTNKGLVRFMLGCHSSQGYPQLQARVQKQMSTLHSTLQLIRQKAVAYPQTLDWIHQSFPQALVLQWHLELIRH